MFNIFIKSEKLTKFDQIYDKVVLLKPETLLRNY